jgi:hypothetical protein
MKARPKTKTKADPQKAAAILRRIQQLSDRFGGPTKGMSKAEILRSIKKVRQELWDKYLAPGS